MMKSIVLGDQISSYDLGVLSTWAAQQKQMAAGDFKRPYALMRDAADQLLRLRALQTEPTGNHAKERICK
jgi:hypothetical protein